MTPGSPHSSGQYFEENPSARSRPSTVQLALPDISATLSTDSGVFSAQRVDPGTKALLVEMASAHGSTNWPGGDLVDLGCGYGPITIALALRHPDRTVWAVDTNRRALELTARNAELAGVAQRVRPVAPEEVPEMLTVSALVSNPPIRVGKARLHEILSTWLERLEFGGEAWLVVAKNLGSDSLLKWLVERRH
ncbi:MAG: class I SAM-dependent methyltransferase, partial [Microthrixaceae bacterium]